MTDVKNIALFIDADNISAKYVKIIFDELNNIGTVSIRRIYGNWKKNYDWNEALLLDYSITPMQQFDYAKHKNASDITMVIDVMDVMYARKIDVFCIVTSDSDFTKLATRLREENLEVIGMGESKTPNSFVKACNRFIHMDLLYLDRNEAPETEKNEEDSVTPLKVVKRAINDMLMNNSGEMLLSDLGNALNRKFSDFDTRNYGYSNLTAFISRTMTTTVNVGVNGNNSKYAALKASINLEDIYASVKDYVAKNGGKVYPLQKIDAFLTENCPDFSFKAFGFSRLSSFVKSIPGLTVYKNTVKTENNVRKTENVSKRENYDRASVSEGIVEFIRENNGYVKPISKIGDYIKLTYDSFNYRQYSCSSLKQFLKTIPEIKVIKESASLIESKTAESKPIGLETVAEETEKKEQPEKKTGRTRRSSVKKQPEKIDPLKDIKTAVIAFITKKGGSIHPLAPLTRHLKSVHSFEYKNYGYGKISDFLRDIEGIKVEGNSARLSEQ